MPSKISGLMYGEHAIILEAADISSTLDRTWEVDPIAYEKTMVMLLNFFSEYADRFHHYKEEDILFPAMQRTDELSAISMVCEFTEHHEEFRELALLIRADMMDKNYAAAQAKLNVYMNSLQDHIAAENEELFPMADTLLSEEVLERLYFQCLDKDAELGQTRKEEMENEIKNFKLK